MLQEYVQRRIAWELTGNRYVPFRSVVDGTELLIAINDGYPELEADYYSLLINGHAIGSFTAWPADWSRPTVKWSARMLLDGFRHFFGNWTH